MVIKAKIKAIKKVQAINPNDNPDPSSIESIYQKLKHREHVLTLPDTYIGSIASETKEMFVYDDSSQQMVKKTIEFIPGLYKIFDECLVNMGDHHVRMKETLRRQALIKAGQLPPDPKIDINRTYYPVKSMQIWINPDTGMIKMRNDGDGLDVAMHQKEQMYVPEMVFGSLLTGANFDQGENRITGGKNGYGAKLANIFSKSFTVETVDAYRKKKYIQTFRENMSVIDPPTITSYRGRPYTEITFFPDLERFGLTKMTDDQTVDLMIKRVYDLAGCTESDVVVKLNGTKIPYKGFERYVDLYIGTRGQTKRIFKKLDDRWELAVCVSPDHNLEHVSFVNGICTYRGGKHVDRIADILSSKITKYAQENRKGMKGLQRRYVRDNLWIFLKSTIIEPDFDTQTKEYLTTNVVSAEIKRRGRKYPNLNRFDPKLIDDDFIKKLSASNMGILNKALAVSTFKESHANLSKSDGRKTSKVKSEKLLEGQYPGTKRSMKCVLILAEGDSAMTSAVSGLTGLSEEQRKYFGVFPLRGKLINPKDAKLSTIEKNNEFTELKKIIGLKQGVDYSSPVNRQTLRYGSVWVLTDSDLDGDHIKGLVFNLFHSYWPSLLKVQGFFKSLLTPILKVRKKSNKKIVMDFYSEQDFEKWKEQEIAKGTYHQWGKAKYYKGLGTHDRIEAREWFTNQKLQEYVWVDFNHLREQMLSQVPEPSPMTSSSSQSSISSQSSQSSIISLPPKDISTFWDSPKDECQLSMELAFCKKNANYRKDWITRYLISKARGETNHSLHLIKSLSYSDFINQKFIEFSVYDCIRNIPNLLDGLKPSQRKILFTCLNLRKPQEEIKVAQLAGKVALVSAYHHGETSLANTIIGMAQNFPGSNNLNLLFPAGQFGSRKGKGTDASSPRYIHTYLEPLASHIFHKDDMPLYDYLDDDGTPIEPRWYLPIIPMVLVNGVQGIGTGWSTLVPSFNPRDIIDNIRRYLAGQPLVEMIPWYRGFKGTIQKTGPQKYRVVGCYHRTGPTTLEITEIPVGDSKQTKSFDAYKVHLEKQIKSDQNPSGFLTDVEIMISDTSIKCLVTFVSEKKLTDLLKTPETGIEKHLKLAYNMRTSNMYLFNSEEVMTKYSSAEEILQEFCQQRIRLYGTRKEYQLNQLEEKLAKIGARVLFIKKIIDPDDSFTVNNTPKTKIISQLTEANFPMLGEPASYDYLLSMPIWSLTKEKLEQLIKEQENLMDQLETLKKTPIHQLWVNDLDKLVNDLPAFEAKWGEMYEDLIKVGSSRPLIKAKKKKKVKAVTRIKLEAVTEDI